MTLHLLLAATTSTTAASSKKSSGSSYGFLIIIVVLVAFYFLIIRPRSQRQRQTRTQAATIEIGDAVMSVGGIKGTVVDLDDTDVQVEVSPGIILTFIRRAISVQPGPTPTVDDEPAGVVDGDYDEQHDEDEYGDADFEEGTDEGPDDRPGTGTESR